MAFNKSITQIMRSLHRDLGFFLVGLIVVYSLSGIVLVYRNTNFLKADKTIEKTLSPNLNEEQLLNTLKIKGAKIISINNNEILFTGGSYNTITGEAKYMVKDPVAPMNKFISLHKTIGSSPMHWIATFVGIILFFLAVSSFWMFKLGTKLFKRGVIIASAGVIFTVLLLFLV